MSNFQELICPSCRKPHLVDNDELPEEGEFRACPDLGSLVTQQINALYEDSRGRVWAGTPGGLFAIFDSTQYGEYGVDDGLSSTTILALGEDRDGSLLVSHGGVPQVLREGRSTRHAAASSVEGVIIAIASDGAGAILMLIKLVMVAILGLMQYALLKIKQRLSARWKNEIPGLSDRGIFVIDAKIQEEIKKYHGLSQPAPTAGT